MFYYKILLILFLTFLSFYPVMANVNIEDTEKTIPEIGISRQLANKRASIYSHIRYKLNYEIKPMDENLIGHIEIELQISNPSESLILDFKSLGDDPNQLNGTLRNNFLVVNGHIITDFQQVNGHIIIPSKTLKVGNNSLELSFICPVRKSGAAITRYIDKDDNNEYLYSLFVPSDAHMAFPCFDQPDLKARFSLSITCPGHWAVVTNTPLKERISNRPGHFQIGTFEETKALSTYLFAFAAGPFSQLEIENSKTPIDLYVRKSKESKAKNELKEIARLHREGLETLASYFDYPYPFGKCDMVILPEFAYGGMEHAGAIFFREDRMLFPNEPSPNDLLNRASLILHEAAHQWFGNLVTMRWFDDLWLKEGFATFMAYQAMEKVFPGNVWKNFYQANKPRAYSTDSTKGTTPIFQEIPNLKDAKSAYGNIVYTKAPSMLRQLEFYLGKEAFQKGVQVFLSSYAFSNAEWSDLIKCYEKSAGYSLKTWADAWVKRRAMAVVEPVLTIRAGKIHTLSLKQNNILGEDTIWPLKTKLILAYTNQPAIVLTVSLTSTTTVVTDVVGKPKPDYIFANYEDFGYGEFRLDSKSLAYIKSNLANVSDQFLRSLLWGAIWNAVQQGVFAPVEYLELVCQALSKEEDPITVQLVLSNSAVAFSHYLSFQQKNKIAPKLETMLFQEIKSDKSLGLRLTYFRSLPNLISSAEGRKQLVDLLEGKMSFDKIELKAKDRWELITSLISQSDPMAEKLLFIEEKQDLSADAQRYSFIAKAAQANKELKKNYFERYLQDRELAENWIETSLRAFNSPNQANLTIGYLRSALAALPQLKKQRKIFFINEWLAAFISGQSSPQALEIVQQYLRENSIDRDLQLKVLEASDKLEKCVKSRSKYASKKSIKSSK